MSLVYLKFYFLILWENFHSICKDFTKFSNFIKSNWRQFSLTSAAAAAAYAYSPHTTSIVLSSSSSSSLRNETRRRSNVIFHSNIVPMPFLRLWRHVFRYFVTLRKGKMFSSPCGRLSEWASEWERAENSIQIVSLVCGCHWGYPRWDIYQVKRQWQYAATTAVVAAAAAMSDKI